MDLSSEQIDKFRKLLLNYRHIFRKKPGSCRTYKYRLRLKDRGAVIRRNYPIPVGMVNKVDDEIKRM